MINVRRLKRPNRKSGHPLEPGKSTFVRGVKITNTTKDVIYVDKFTPYYLRSKAKKKKIKRAT